MNPNTLYYNRNSSSSASSASSSGDKSYNVLIKKAMAKMPMSLDNKKSIDEYYKTAMKKINLKMKAVEKAMKAAEKARKDAEKAAEKARKAAVSKPKAAVSKPKAAKAAKGSKKPTERKLFFDKMRPRVKEMFPHLSTAQATKKIGELWKREQGEDIYRI
jgi:colicin import membrane protein